MKKNIFFLWGFIFALSTIIIGCKKEEMSSKSSGSSSGAQVEDVIFENGMLSFRDMETLNMYLQNLEEKVTAHNTNFINQYPDLSDEELNNLMDSMRFHEDQPLMDFESQFPGFRSLRKRLHQLELEWLEQDGENIEQDPDNHFIEEGEVRTILNHSLQVKIGGIVYQLMEEGWTETSAERGTVFRNASEELTTDSKDPSFLLMSNDCRSNKRKSDFKVSGSKRIKWVISHWTHPWSNRRVMAKTKNYEKKNGKWKKYSTFCQAKPWGDISGHPGDCSTSVSFYCQSNASCPPKNETKKKVKFPIKVQTLTKSGWVKGYHYGAGGITHNSTLTW